MKPETSTCDNTTNLIISAGCEIPKDEIDEVMEALKISTEKTKANWQRLLDAPTSKEECCDYDGKIRDQTTDKRLVEGVSSKTWTSDSNAMSSSFKIVVKKTQPEDKIDKKTQATFTKSEEMIDLTMVPKEADKADSKDSSITSETSSMSGEMIFKKYRTNGLEIKGVAYF